eukprot:6125338-Pleurochrysis_carterae.AAC.1
MSTTSMGVVERVKERKGSGMRQARQSALQRQGHCREGGSRGQARSAAYVWDSGDGAARLAAAAETEVSYSAEENVSTRLRGSGGGGCAEAGDVWGCGTG